MSSFVGLLQLDGAPCDASVIEAMLGRLSHRVTAEGARRASVRCRGALGLGCAVLPTTAAARREMERPDDHQVWREGERELWIACDGRLDNRDEIIGALGAPSGAREWSDGRLMLAAYARWGEDSVRRLRGDFAFAIWDARRQTLFCARDPLGVKPFYYAHVPGQFFAFASEIKALWCVPGLDASANPAHIADYLASQLRDKTSTFYRNAQRLAPAHWMTVSGEGEARPQLYWELDEQSELRLDGNARANDEEYARRVRASFGESLQQRMRCEGKLAAFLSGGLDSSSIAALAEQQIEAARKPLTTFSTVFERFAQCDERAYIDQTLARGEFAPLWMNGDDISPLDAMERVIWHLDGPSSGPNICSAWAQYRHLQDAGVRVVLDGHGGDEIICIGYERVGELLRAGQFATAWHEIRLLHRHGVTRQAPAQQMWSALLWHARDKRGWGRLTRPLRRRYVRRAREADTTQQLFAHSLDAIAPQTLALLEAEKPAPRDQSTRQHHAETIAMTIQPSALEAMDAMSGAHALETRCPFWEQQLVQLCLSLPADQKMRDGHNRYVMRRAMEGVLAPAVQWRRDKTDFGPQLTTALREREHQRLDRFLDNWEQMVPALESYVDMERAQSHWQALQNAPFGSVEAVLYSTVLWKIFSLGTWLVNPTDSPTAPRSPAF